MQRSDHESASLTPQESWGAIRATMEEARSSMYLAGSATILLLWGVIVSLGFISQFAVETLASEFATRIAWISAPLWGVLVVAGMLGSAVIGHHAGRKNAAGEAVRSAGIRIFLYWVAVAAAATLTVAALGTVWIRKSGVL